MVLDDSASLTDRWFVDSDVPLASQELTREIRDIDMLPVNEFDRRQLADALAYRAVSLRGAHMLPTDPPESYADDDLTDAHELEDPFDNRGAMELPQNWAGSMHDRVARLVERGFEAWERLRLRAQAFLHTGVGQRGLSARLPEFRIAAGATAVASVLLVVLGVAAALATAGSTARPDDPETSAKQLLAQQRALQQIAAEWALAQGAVDMEFSVDEAQAEPDAEVSAAERRQLARAENAQRRRRWLRQRRARRR